MFLLHWFIFVKMYFSNNTFEKYVFAEIMEFQQKYKNLVCNKISLYKNILYSEMCLVTPVQLLLSMLVNKLGDPEYKVSFFIDSN